VVAADASYAEMRRSARAVIRATSPLPVSVAGPEPGGLAPVWPRLVDLGLADVALEAPGPEAGAALVIVFEELGRELVGSPALTAVLAAAVLRLAFPDGEQHPAVHALRGARPPALAGGLAAPGAMLACSLGPGRPPGTVTGSVAPVLYATHADYVVLIAEEADWVAVATAARLGLVPLATLDLTEVACEITLTAAPAEMLPVPMATARRSVRVLARLLIAAEQLGAACACIDATARYATTRVQFGIPIGSFQAVKHRLADLHVSAELARCLVLDAAAGYGGDPREEERAVSMAYVAASRLLDEAALQAIQLHGGIGMTWELPMHHYLRRGRSRGALLDGTGADVDWLAGDLLDRSASAPAETK
jgi:alkylation response protein AidB-like acyl-CoA dehydrogenase